MQRFKLIDFMVIEVEDEDAGNMDKMWKSCFQILYTSYITTQ